jgi:uncharacterized protein YkwD
MSLVSKPKQRPPAHVQKRLGQHHRHSKHYVKAYWPYLPAALIIAGGFWVNSAWSKQTAVLGASSSFSNSSFLNSTNADRTAAHEAALTLNPELEAAAQAKANDMVSRNYWSHTTPDGQTPWSFITAAGYTYQTAGENLAYGFANASDTVTGWMNSAEHRANILNTTYKDVGFGVASSPDYQSKGSEVVVVAMYADPVSNPAVTAGSGAVSSPVDLDTSSQLVSRVQLLTGGHATWSVVALSFICGAAAAVYLIQHGFRLRKLVVKGEVLASEHPFIDITIVFIAVAAFVLTRTGGIIR